MTSPEEWILERLKHHGADVYAGGPYETLRDRLAHTIVTNRLGPVVVGRHARKPQTYEQVFERVYGMPLRKVGNEGQPAPGRTWKGKAS